LHSEKTAAVLLPSSKNVAVTQKQSKGYNKQRSSKPAEQNDIDLIHTSAT
jgi:hypothetical protein